MTWLDRLLGRAPLEHEQELAEDREALDRLHVSLQEVRGRTNRILDDYRAAEKLRLRDR